MDLRGSGDPLRPTYKGDKNALKQAVVAVKARTPRVGLVIDADADPNERWADIRQRLENVGLTLPATYPTTGFVGELDGRRFGVWMMPHGGQSGAIETFLHDMIPASPLAKHAVDATDQARMSGANFADKDRAKAQLRAWLAWQEAPGAPYGRAIDLGYFSAPSTWADELVGWFRRVYLD